jgi:hypothetical protein
MGEAMYGAFMALKACLALKMQRSARGPQGPPGHAAGGNSRALVAHGTHETGTGVIETSVREAVATLAPDLNHQLWLAFAPAGPSPLAPYTASDTPAQWGKWCPAGERKAALLERLRQPELLPDSDVEALARQTMSYPGGVAVARTVCTVGAHAALYVVTTVEVGESVFVCKTEPLLAAGPVEAFYSASLEQFSRDDPDAALAVFTAIGAQMPASDAEKQAAA